MSDLLFLASDYIERMSNPVYGVSMNEDYGLKLATLLRREGFEASLTEEIRSLRDPNTLTSFGWLWLFGWARARNIALDEDLLIALYEEWSSEFIKAAIVELATQDFKYSPNPIPKPYPTQTSLIEEFPNRFLSRIMAQATRVSDAKLDPSEDRPSAQRNAMSPEEEQNQFEQEPSTELAESTLIALLQVGSDITTDAAKVLLEHEWPGKDQLLESFREILDGLEPETRKVWITRLEPPEFEVR